MPEASTEAFQTTLLRLFERPADGRLSAGDLRRRLGLDAKKGVPTGPDATEADRTIAGLIEDGLIATSGGARDGHHPRPNASYRLTDKGRAHLRPARPEIPDTQLEAQEAFILLKFFQAEGQKLTRSDLNGKLKSKAAMGQLEFDVKQEPTTVAYHLATLVEKGCLEEQRRGISVGYTLVPDQGAKALVSARHHDTVGFTMTGATLNALLAAARRSEPVYPGPDDRPEDDNVPDAEPNPVGPRDIARYVDQLRSGPYAGKDLVPIHEVRRLVAEHHGAESAGHAALDPLLMEMRSEDQLELIAISDNSRATPRQLDDSIPGVNETIFYVVVG